MYETYKSYAHSFYIYVIYIGIHILLLNLSSYLKNLVLKVHEAITISSFGYFTEISIRLYL